MPRSLLAVAVTVALAGPLAAQGLGDLAAQEKERRARLKGQKARTFTDEDLKKGKPASTPEGQTASEGGQSFTPSAGSSDETPDRAHWRARADTARGEVKEAEAKVAQIEERIAALLADREPTNPLDPFRDQTRLSELGKARQELETAQAAVTTARKALADLEEEARQKSIPPGWLREE